MNTKLRIALALGALAFTAQAAAQVTFYEKEGFRGRTFTTQQQVGNLERYGFNDRASSVVVAAGTRWEVCSDAQFRGSCAVLRPGRYPSLASLGLNDRVTSARTVNMNSRIDDGRYAPAAAHVTFYEHDNFQGRSFTSERQVNNFQSVGFNDLASSVDVVGQSWEICEHADFGGRCIVLRPGRYPSFGSMGLNDRVSSVREVDSHARADDRRYAPGNDQQSEERRDYYRRQN
jgi:hypothetical protein